MTYAGAIRNLYPVLDNKFDCINCILYNYKMQSLKNILIVLAFINTIDAQGIQITQYPGPSIVRGSNQIISWSSPIKLDQITIDLYQNNAMRERLGQTSQSISNYN